MVCNGRMQRVALAVETSTGRKSLIKFFQPVKLFRMQRRRSRHAVIRVYDEAGNVIEMHEHAGEFKEPSSRSISQARTGIATL
jgi:hypothetical protein